MNGVTHVQLKPEALTVNYAGAICLFAQECDTIDEAQAVLDYWRGRGRKACCLHMHDKHQVYLECQHQHTHYTGVVPCTGRLICDDCGRQAN
jgi:hypothetical protein